MVTADLRESACERGGRAAGLPVTQYDCIFTEIALTHSTLNIYMHKQQTTTRKPIYRTCSGFVTCLLACLRWRAWKALFLT